jgi:hypothetical protein
MKIEFELRHAIEGAFIISEPEGWPGASLSMERHPDFHCLVTTFKSPMNLYGENVISTPQINGFRDWVKMIERLYGVNAEIEEIVRFQNYEFGPKRELFRGSLPIVTLTEIASHDHTIQFASTPTSTWSKLLARFQTEVDILAAVDKDGGAVSVMAEKILRLKSQIIPYNFKATQSTYHEYESADDIADGDKFSLTVDNASVDEFSDIKNGSGYLYPLNGDFDVAFPGSEFIAPYKGTYTFERRISLSFKSSGNYWGAFGYASVYFRIIRKDGSFADYILTKQSYYEDGTPATSGPGDLGDYTAYTYNDTHNLEAGEEVVLIGVYDFSGTDPGIAFDDRIISWADDNSTYTGVDPVLNFDSPPNYLNVHSQTEYPETETPAFLLHDVGSAILDRILGGDKRLYSEYLGNPDTIRAYENTGGGSLNMLAKILHVRGYSLADKKFFDTLEKWWKGVNPHYNLGLGYAIKNIDGQDFEVIEVEEKRKFYDDSSMSIVLLNVRNIERSYDLEQLFNVVEFGSTQWEPKDVSGIDVPQSVKSWSSVFKTFGKKLIMLSEFFSSDIGIESARRKRVEQSKDYEYDNKTAIINVIKEDDEYIPRTDEGFSATTGLENPDSRYNKILTPARALKRWLNYIAGGLFQYPASLLNFDAGVGNYDMSTTTVDAVQPESNNGAPTSESGNYVVGEDRLFIPMPYKITGHPLTEEQFAYLDANKKLAIGVSQTSGNAKKFFIKALDYKVAEGVVDLVVWPKEFFDIVVQDNPSPPLTYIFDSSFEHGTFE